jgi:hypothetical protein
VSINRRGSRRQAAKRSTKVSCTAGVMGAGPNLAAAVLDLSQTGVRLLLQAPLRAGQALELTLENVMLSRPIKVTAEVVWSVPAADGRHCVGARFHRPLSYADVQSLAYT